MVISFFLIQILIREIFKTNYRNTNIIKFYINI